MREKTGAIIGIVLLAVVIPISLVIVYGLRHVYEDDLGVLAAVCVTGAFGFRGITGSEHQFAYNAARSQSKNY
jgi:hypothetical protein